MRATLNIAWKDLRQRVRDRSAIILGVVAPLVLAFVFDLIFGNTLEGQFSATLGVVDLDGGVVAEQMVTGIQAAGEELGMEIVTGLEESAARQRVEDGDLDAYYLLPEGLTEAAEGGSPAQIEVVGNVDAPTDTAIASAIGEALAARIETTQLSVALVASGGDVGQDQLGEIAVEAAHQPPTITIEQASAETRQLDQATYLAAGMASFFLFFTVAFGVTGLLQEKEEGTMARLLAAPISRFSIVGGKALTSFVFGLASLVVLSVATTLLLDANWGDPLGAFLLMVALSLAAVGIMSLVAGFAKTVEQAGALQGIVAVVLGLLGGSFFQFARRGILADLSLLTPNAWFMRGLGDNVAEGAAAVLPAVGAILLFALVTGSIGAFTLYRKVTL
jgi:ABC-2 type transport system permease protein